MPGTDDLMDPKSFSLNNLAPADLVPFARNEKNIEGDSAISIFWLTDPVKEPGRMSVMLIEGKPHSERTISIAECVGHMLDGEATLELEAEPWIELKPGVVFALPTGKALTWRFKTPFRLLCVYPGTWTPLGERDVFAAEA